MDLRTFYQKVREVQSSIADDPTLVTSLQTPEGGKPGIISREKIREARFPFWTCATARATEELHFTAATSIESGLAETLAWYKEAGWLTY